MRAKELLITEEQLNEIDMSPRGLQQLASQIDARAGMEFEMIVPGVHQEDDEPEWEADYDQDQRTRSFDDIRSFFHDGDYNGRRQVDNLIEEIENEYMDWQMEQTSDAWGRDGVTFMNDYVSVNDLFDRNEAIDAARDQVMDANPDLPQESEDFSRLLSARLDEMELEFARAEYEEQGRIYNDAFEAFAEEQRDEYDERSFLDDRYPYMTDIENNFDIQWPYYTDMNEGSGGEMDVDQVADEFSSAMGKPVNASRSYHGARREPGHYVVEPDGSLEGDNPGDAGLEFVSPPMPVAELLVDLQKVKAWADATGCYTNDSTGLHINVSVPGLKGVGETLDYVKLALLLGDERVLNEFGRAGNTYAKSAVEIVRKRVVDQPEDAASLLNQMRGHLANMASKAIHSGVTNKFTSINTKDGYIEFRSPGGDWLGANFELIVPTLLRFVVALDAAIDPNKYRKEYLKKLYKLLSPKSEEDLLAHFAKFSAGELPKQALKSFVRQAQLQRKITKDPTGGKKYWWSVGRPGYFASVEVVARTREEAIEKGKVEYPDWRNSTNMTAKPLRPYVEPQTTRAAGPTLNGRPSNPDGNYVIVTHQNQSVPVYRYMASGDYDALLVLRQWISANPGQTWTFKQDNNQTLGQPGAQPAADHQGNWGIWMTGANRFARQRGQIDNNVLRRFPSREAAEQFLVSTREENPQMRTDIEVREIPADYPGVAGSATTTQQPQFQEPNANRGDLTPRGPGPWELYRLSDNSGVRELGSTDRMAAVEEARRALGLRGEAPELYGVRTQQAAVPGSTIDLQRQRAAQAGGEFRGTWRIMIDGEEVHQISGIGNNQGDANRIGRDWILRQISRGELRPAEGAEIEVLPLMEP